MSVDERRRADGDFLDVANAVRADRRNPSGDVASPSDDAFGQRATADDRVAKERETARRRVDAFFDVFEATDDRIEVVIKERLRGRVDAERFEVERDRRVVTVDIKKPARI